MAKKQFGWHDASVAAGGRIYEGIEGFKYKKSQEKDFLYGRGNKPHKIVRGNYAFEGTLKIWQSELEAMIEDAPDNDILKLNFDVIYTYVPADGGRTVTNITVGAEIKEYEKGMAQGDKNMVIELPIIFLDLKELQ